MFPVTKYGIEPKLLPSEAQYHQRVNELTGPFKPSKPKIQLSDNTSAQTITTLHTSTDTIESNTNVTNNTNNTNTEPSTPTKQSSGSKRDSDLFVLMLREARPGSPFKNKYVLQ